MRRRAPITDRQLELLRRIGAGNDLAAADNGSKRSAAALHDRGLVVVHRSPWRAAITEVGRYYLEHGEHPDASQLTSSDGQVERGTLLLQAGVKGPAARPADQGATHPAAQRRRQPPHATARISAARRAAAAKLIDELLVSGSKIIKRPDKAAQVEWRRVVDFAKRNCLVPTGKRLEKATINWHDLQISLVDGPHANSRTGTAPAVAMSAQLRGMHQVVKAIQADPGRLRMPESLRTRALLYFHGLTREAVRRGHAAQEVPVADHYRGRVTTYGRPGVPDYSLRHGELAVVVEGFSYRVIIDQEHPEAEELERFCQLVVTVRGPGQAHGCRHRWYDRQRSTIDDSIGPVLAEIERWAAAAHRIQADRQALWQTAMDEAVRLATQDRLVAELEQQTERWRKHRELLRYCDALETRILEAGADEPVEEARRWLSWARTHADAMDPLLELPVSPAPALRPEELEPYLDGWSPRGPDVFVPRWRGARWQLPH